MVFDHDHVAGVRTAGALRVEALRGFAAVARLRAEIDAVNLASRRPCPFATYEYMSAWLANDEYGARDDEVLVLAAFDGEALVGYLPLRRRRARAFGLPYRRLEVLVWHDTDRPHVVARHEDEARCARAFYGHLLERERGWSLMELAMQDGDSFLNSLPALSARFYARRFDNMPNTTVPLRGFDSPAAYFASLAPSHRKNVARLGRRLLEAGDVAFVSCDDPSARAELLELYLDLERRSWKEAAHVGIGRDPRRVAFFRALCERGQPLQIGFDFVLLDDLPIAGLVRGAFAGGLYGLEMAFDDDCVDLAPGHMLSTLAIARGIDGASHSFNFNGNYAIYKAKMGGVVTPTSAIQIYRVGSLPWLHARLGDVRRRLRPEETADSRMNPERRRVKQDEDVHASGAGAARERPPRIAERSRTRAVLSSLEARGVRIDRFAGAALTQRLPYATRREAA